MTNTRWTKDEIQELKFKFSQMTPVDIADYFDGFNEEQRAIAISLLDKTTLAEVFSEFSADQKEEMINTLSQPEITELLFEMDSDDVVDVIQELPSNMVTKMLSNVDSGRRNIINQLLNFPEESVGSLMSVDFVTIHKGATRQEAIDKIKSSDAGYEHLTELYVLGEKRELIGYVYVADLIRLDEESIESIINYDVISAKTMTDQEEAARYFNKYHFLALPVTDSEDRLVGIITADDIFEVIADEIYEDYALMQGVQITKLGYLESTPWHLARQRVFWLLFLMVSATFTGKIIQSYDAVLSASVILAAYIPMLMDSGGNSGSQSSTIVIRALALDEIHTKDFLKVAFKESSVGMIVGSIVAVINYLRIIFFDKTDPKIALAVSITLFFTIVISKLVGGLLPLAAKLANQDPAVMASPLITTIVDAISLMIYFAIVSNLLM